MRRKHRDHPFKPEDRSVHVRLLQHHAGIVHAISGGEVVGAVNDDVVGRDKVQHIAAVDDGFVLDQLDIRIEILQPLGLDLVEAAKHYAAHHKAITGGIKLSEAVDRFLQTRSGADYSPIYRKALSHHLKRFTEAFPEKTSRTITSEEIDTFLSGCGAVESIKTYRRILTSFFNDLMTEEQCEKNPVDSPTAAEAAEINQKKSASDAAWVAMGAVDGLDVRQRLIKDRDSGYTGISDMVPGGPGDREAQQEAEAALEQPITAKVTAKNQAETTDEGDAPDA